MATDLPPGGEWWPAPECTVVHPYGAEGWRPGTDGVHEHYVTVSLNVGFSLTDAEDDDAMRSYVSNLWADDWNSPEDSVYDEPQLTWSLVRLWCQRRTVAPEPGSCARSREDPNMTHPDSNIKTVTLRTLTERQRAISNAGNLWPPLNEVITPGELSDLLRDSTPAPDQPAETRSCKNNDPHEPHDRIVGQYLPVGEIGHVAHCPGVADPVVTEVPRGFRRWWIQPFRSIDDSAWPFIHSIGVKGRFRHKFFSVSLAWGTKKARTW